MDTYNSIFNNYADYTKIDLPNHECYKERNTEKFSSNKCNESDVNKKLNDRFYNDTNQNEDDCKNIFLNSNIKNSSSSNINLYNNKSNKILTKRIINTIPYRNYIYNYYNF